MQKEHYLINPWQIIEEGFNPKNQEASESIFSLGNGKMGQRANFEEYYSGKTLQGNYVAGVYYPDKTRVGWWKNGYPEYFAKVLNAPNWMYLDINVNGSRLDLAKAEIGNFRRTLHMKHSLLQRNCSLSIGGVELEIESERFLSIVKDEIAAIKYSIKAVSADVDLILESAIDLDVHNKDSNYDEYFWNIMSQSAANEFSTAQTQTKKSLFEVAYAIKHAFKLGDNDVTLHAEPMSIEHKRTGYRFTHKLKKGETLILYKYAGICSSLNYASGLLKNAAISVCESAFTLGYENLKKEHCSAWENIWHHADIQIEGDEAAQQGIRFNIFQLYQTYTGTDHRLNIGPKGFTGEKYGGSTYWDTEAYCIPFYLHTAPQNVARQLLSYRYKQLDKAIENAAKLGFKNGAALYPMVTMNGEECHNEWEITFEEIHRNGAIAYAIYYYLKYTKDYSYLFEGGLEVLVAIARFWAQRFNWSEAKQQYVMLGVTGPNEYENNVNNNWYTNYIARWCIQYAGEALAHCQALNSKDSELIQAKVGLHAEELNNWKSISENIHFPYDEKLDVFLQQEGYLDKEQRFADDLNPNERPINQHWSWDRILRSCFIKQADVLQGIFFFEDDFSVDQIKRNFDFYEPRTVHESSLSPCVHAILAAKLGYEEKAYEMYLRTSRLDLDDYNKEVHEGLHITSMAGTWMSVVLGFGGLRMRDGVLHFNPVLPKQWKAFKFTIRHRDCLIEVNANNNEVKVSLLEGELLGVAVHGIEKTLRPNTPEAWSAKI